MKSVKEILLIAIAGLILAFIFAKVMQSLGSSNHNGEVVNRTIDTVWSKPDTIVQTYTVIITKLQAELDTVFVDSAEVITASADTVINKDSSSLAVKYFFPPLNFFEIDMDLREKVITKEKTILDSVTVEVHKPFYKDQWFWTTVITGILFIAKLFGGG